MLKNLFKRIIIMVISVISLGSGVSVCAVYAEEEASVGARMSPMNQVIILNPGDRYEGSFDISNTESNALPFDYTTDVVPFFINDKNNIEYTEEGSYNLMMDWITLSKQSGTLDKNDSETIYFTIDVPDDAPSGGQYAGIRVISKPSDSNKEGMNIKISQAMVHLIYAEITGTTVKVGEVLDANVPGFVFDGNIKASSSIENTGNVHGVAKYTMQVFPLFSSEEVYTNEEKPELEYVFPGRKLYKETAWSETPAVGIFNVVYTVEFEGSTAQVSKMVIKCPIWLLAIIIFAIVALIIWLVVRAKARKKQ